MPAEETRPTEFCISLQGVHKTRRDGRNSVDDKVVGGKNFFVLRKEPNGQKQKKEKTKRTIHDDFLPDRVAGTVRRYRKNLRDGGVKNNFHLRIGVLILLLTFQRWGTAGVGSVFGPIMLVWFETFAFLGPLSVVREPTVLVALSPLHAVHFMRKGSRLSGALRKECVKRLDLTVSLAATA
jgi:hypothetical protein